MDQSLKSLLRSHTALISKEELLEKIKRGNPLRVKLGVDPTADHLTLGWAVVFRKLRDFQDLGHQACLIIGDFTARIGDPTGKNKTRPQLVKEQVDDYTNSILQQVFKILDPSKTTLYYNSEWHDKLSFEEVIRLASRVTVARILERDDFTKRLEEQKPLSLHEILYPLCQAYDSVQIKADIELGGSDQLFNCLLGRTLMSQFNLEPQVVMSSPLLVGLDGKEKMSQSLGNYIGITESPNQIFGKTMSIPDDLILNWFELATDVDLEEIETFKQELDSGIMNPRDAKVRLAREIVGLYHGLPAAENAETYFVQTFSKREVPIDVPEVVLQSEWFIEGGLRLPQLLVILGLIESNGEGKRLMQSGGVSLDGEKCMDIAHLFLLGSLRDKVLKVGKHQFRKLVDR